MDIVIKTTLSIESTCDDTSIALVTNHDGRFVVHRMLTYTQWSHNAYGGVVPEIASRDHAVRFPRLISSLWVTKKGSVVVSDVTRRRALDEWVKEFVGDIWEWESYWRREEWCLVIDEITVASHPWLPWSIVAWVTTATFLWSYYDVPVREVNHIMGHVFSILLDREVSILQLPYLCLTVSGGHSDIYIVEELKDWKMETCRDVLLARPQNDSAWTRHKRWHMWICESIQVWPYTITKLVQTMDDAVGEVYDKVAKMLWGPYPWGAWIEQQAARRDDGLPRPHDNIHSVVHERLRKIDVGGQFSFSGIKAQVHSLLEYMKRHEIVLDEMTVCAIAHRFQDVVTDAMSRKMQAYIKLYTPRTVWVVWGVSANKIIRKKMLDVAQSEWISHVYTPVRMAYCTDNAAMIGAVGLLE